MLFGIGIYRFFGLFLGAVNVRMPDFAGHGDGNVPGALRFLRYACRLGMTIQWRR
jgi:hypothetical protein